MRAFMLFIIFLFFMSLLYLLAKNYGVKDPAVTAPLAEREAIDPGATAVAAKKPENPVRGIEALRGMVIDAANSPVANAEVVIIETDLEGLDAFRVPRKRDTWYVTTDTEGAFAVNTLAPGGYVVYTNQPEGVSAATLTLEARGSAGEVTLRLAPGRKVSGAVFDWQGRAVKGAHVFALAPQTTNPTLAPYRFLPAITAADGSFLFPSLPAIESSFLAVADDLAPTLIRESEQQVPEGQRPAPLRFTLGKGARFAGYLTEAETARPADKSALVVTENEFGMERYRKYTTGAASFLFENLRPGMYQVAIESPRYALQQCPFSIEVRDGMGNLDVRVVRAGRIKGRVLHEGGREGVPGIRIVATSQERADSHDTITGPSGYYAIEGLSPGVWIIDADDPHGDFTIRGETRVEVVSGRAIDGPEYTMKRGATISGRVVDAEGRPVVGANVFFSLKGARSGDRSTRTGEDGRFEQGGIPPEAEVRIWAERLGKASVTLGPEKVPNEGLHELTFSLTESTPLPAQ